MDGDLELRDDLSVSDLKDVTGSVWLATALLAYNEARGLDPKRGPYDDERFAFRQVDIQQLAEQICAKHVQNARISQHANGDHADSTYNYLREVGKQRRLSRPDEFEGYRVLPAGLIPDDTQILGHGEASLTFGDLVDWVKDTYTRLVPAREVPAPSEPLEADAGSQSGSRQAKPSEAVQARMCYPDGILLQDGGEELAFYHAPLSFDSDTRSEIFAEMDSKTAQEMLESPRYRSIQEQTENLSDADLSRPVGPLLAKLKERGDGTYRLFLNDHGDLTYRDFSIEAPDLLARKGLYVFLVDGKVRYIGKTTSSFQKRFNRNYGRVNPRNCFLDGQSTNCRLNHLVAEAGDSVAIYLCPLTEDPEIDRLEDALIARYEPEWNIQGAL